MKNLIWILLGLNTIVVVGYPVILECFEHVWFREWLIGQSWLVNLLI